MRLHLLTKNNILLVVIIMLFSSCGGYKFQKYITAQSDTSPISTARINNITPLEAVKVIHRFPTDRKFVIIGKCYGTSYKGAVTKLDGSYSAFKRLRKCACSNGGNAVVITDKEQVVNPYEYTRTQGMPINIPQGKSQMKVKITGYVIYMQPQALAIEE